jgi:hypothetical protein
VTLTGSERIDPHTFFHETVQFGHGADRLFGPTKTRSDIVDLLEKRLDVLRTGRKCDLVPVFPQGMRRAYRAMSQ